MFWLKLKRPGQWSVYQLKIISFGQNNERRTKTLPFNVLFFRSHSYANQHSEDQQCLIMGATHAVKSNPSVYFKIITHPCSVLCSGVSSVLCTVRKNIFLILGVNLNILLYENKRVCPASVQNHLTNIYSMCTWKSVYSFQVSTSKLWEVQCIHSFLPATYPTWMATMLLLLQLLCKRCSIWSRARHCHMFMIHHSELECECESTWVNQSRCFFSSAPLYQS